MMKKIGIMTFHASHNNGSMLQAVALQNILENKYNCDVKIIDFSNEGQRNMYAPVPKAHNWKQVIKKIIWMTNYNQLIKQYNEYEKFARKYMKLTEKNYLHNNELVGIEAEYDAFIAGSDQVWNIKCVDSDDAYYLNFVNKKPCYAYAVSFGANNPFELDGKSNIHSNLMKRFRFISVRENNAKKWIDKEIGTDVKICLDPTMLYSKDEWENIIDIGDKPVINGNYIFYYCFSITENIQKFLKEVSKKYDMPIYFMDAKEWTLKSCWRNNIKLIKEYGPDVYMNVVKNADIFITTSFHGTAFATIYQKNFWYINDGMLNKKDDRAVSFLTQLDLMGRYKTIDELKNIDLREYPSYKKPYEKLKLLQKESFEYLDLLVKDCEKSE